MAESQWHPSESVYGWSLNGQTWTIMRRADGIPALEGTSDCPSAGLVVWLLVMAAAMVAIPLLALFFGADPLNLSYVGICCGILLVALLRTAVRVISLRRELRHLHSNAGIAARLGISAEAVPNLIASQAISPAFVVNGQPCFRPADFDSIAHLLRLTSAPAAGSLLAAAEFNPHHTAESLPRAAFAPGDEATNVL